MKEIYLGIPFEGIFCEKCGTLLVPSDVIQGIFKKLEIKMPWEEEELTGYEAFLKCKKCDHEEFFFFCGKDVILKYDTREGLARACNSWN